MPYDLEKNDHVILILDLIEKVRMNISAYRSAMNAA